jgi:acrylyl-CoA reductase (NADPH)
MSNTDNFRGFVAFHGDEKTSREVRDDLRFETLGEGDSLIRVAWSSVNYKDGLASTFNGKVARQKTHVPGIDLAGTLIETTDASAPCQPGAEVIVHGYDLGVAHHGGFSEYARVPSQWIVPLPEGLSSRQAMSIGTAGFTAALSIQALEDRGLRPGDGPVLVTGASGGVGSVAVDILAGLGYEVVASTGKVEGAAWLKELGATEIISREETSDASRPLNRERWAGAVDCVGGSTLTYVLSSLRYGASVAASGNTGGIAVNTTVFPFILRGVSLLGIDSVQCPIEIRRALWQRLATDMRPPHLDALATDEVTLDELPETLDGILAGRIKGRTVVRIQ